MNLSKQIIEFSQEIDKDSSLSSELYECVRSCFYLRGGKDYSRSIHDSLLHPKQPHRKRILIYRDLDRENIIAGFAAGIRVATEFKGKKHIFFRGMACFLEEYRGNSLTFAFALSTVIKEHIFKPFTPISFIDSLDLSAYAFFAKYIYKFHPSCRRRTSPDTISFMHYGAKLLGMPLSTKSPFTISDGIITISSHATWPENGISNFFFDIVPDCDNKGDGLLIFVPVTFLNISISFLRYIYLNLIKRINGTERIAACDICLKRQSCNWTARRSAL